MSDVRLAIDFDWVRYAAGFAGEKRHILAIHKQSGDEYQFKNRTEFYGRGKAKNKGWLGEQNATRTSILTADEFDILDVQVPEPIENVLFSAKQMTEKVLNRFDTRDFVGFYGVGDSFRVERSTVLKYKGNREGSLRPMQIDDITDFLVKKYKMKPCTGLEADDWCIIAGQEENTIVVSADKDTGGFPVDWYNPTHDDWGVMNCRCFGKLWLEGEGAKEKIRGIGRKFFYWQVAYGDDVDHYKANAASEVPWGQKSAYIAMQQAQNDKQAFAILVDIFKNLYPEPVEVIGWRGNTITVDWLYMLKEQFDMARMWRSETDEVNVEDILRKFSLI